MPKVIGPGFESWVQKQISIRQQKNQIYSSKEESVLKYQNANDSFIRLTSGIDVLNQNADAQNFQLFSTRFSGVGSKGQFASGVKIGTSANSSYGSFSTANYGYVPPPGIVSADIKALNQGSFREATVNILAHSSIQFEIIEQIYLKLGFSVLLEWGHNTYFDNNGNYQSNNTHESYNVFLDGTKTQKDVLDRIQIQRSSSCGNYDAMLGLVSNYSWDIEKDGSYNITLTIGSVGDVIESLKQNSSHPTTVASTTDVPQDQPPLQYNAEKSTLNRVLYWFTTKIPPSGLSTKYYLQGNETTTNEINAGTGFTSNQNNNSNPSAQGDVVGFIFPELLGINSGQGEFYNAQYFIKLGVLLRCIQNYTLLYNPDKNSEALININTNEEENFCLTYPRQGSLDPRVCLIDVIKDLTGKTPSASPSTPTGSYNINNTYYEFKTVKVEESINNSPPVTQSDEVYGSESSSDGLNIDSYVLDIENPATKTYLNKFLQDNLGTTTTIVTKNGPTTSGTVTSLDNFYANPNSDAGIAVLDKFVPLGLDEADNFQSEFIEQFGTYSPTSPITAQEGKLYLTKVWDQVNQVTSDPSKGKHARGSGRKDLIVTTITITTYRVTVSSLIKTTTGYTDANAVGEGVDVQNNLFDKIRTGSRFRPDNYSFIGRTMNIYINMNCAADILQSNIDIKSGAISVYDFLDTLMKKVQRSLGNINNFSIQYDETKNEFSIIDKTMIPQLGDYLYSTTKVNPFDNKPVTFLTHTLKNNEGSFIREASVKSRISNNFMSQITIGAQVNGNVVGSNAVSLSKWNVGLTDRIIKEKTTVNNGTGATSSDIDQKFYSNVGIVQNLYNAINDGNITDQQIDGATDAGVDLFNYEMGLYANENIIPGVGFIPINLELTMDGLSGMRIMDSYVADTKLLPQKYIDSIQFISTGISHKIQNNDWTTTIQSVSGPKYDGKTITNPPTPKSHSVTVKKSLTYKTSTTTTNTDTRGETSYPELPEIAPPPANLLSYADAVKKLKALTSDSTARAVFAIMTAEARIKDNAFSSAGGYNYAGVQTDSGRWGAGGIISRYRRVDSGGVSREFAVFPDDDGFLKFMISRIEAKGFDGTNGDKWTETYIQKWWSPAAKASYTKGTDTFKAKKAIYETAMRRYNSF